MKKLLIILLMASYVLPFYAAKPVSPHASKEAKALLNFLYDIYGKKTLSGQMWSPWGVDEIALVKEITGKYPAVRGQDLIHDKDNANEIALAIDWWKKGGIPTIMWHWGAPGKGEGYEQSKMAINIDNCFIEGTVENKAMWRDLERIANWLTILRDAHVPILWRPMHECDGNWFWYGKGTGEQFKKIWITMFNYFTKERKLNNLIWVLCHTGDPKHDFNPGKEYYDLAGADTYDKDPVQEKMYHDIQHIHGSRRPIPYHECGTIPDPDKCFSKGVTWSWWMLWHTSFLTKYNRKELKRIYNHKSVLTLDELPEFAPLHKWKKERLIQNIESKNSISKHASSATIAVNVPQRAMYRIKMKYLAKGGNSYSLIINDKTEEASIFTAPICHESKTLDLGKYLLERGRNTITFRAGWGEILFDCFSIYTAPNNRYDISYELVDENANKAARTLYKYLSDNFGKKMIAGHLDGKPINHVTDCIPVLYGWDFQSYTNGYPYHWSKEANDGKGGHTFGAEDSGSVQAAIDWATQKNGIVTFHWHWFAPAGSEPGKNTFYSKNTTFKVSEAVKEGTEENRLILQDIDSIALQLKKLEAAGVAVLWRPLHEAGGGWFWWGAEGPEPCLKLYGILFDRLTNYHQIHNLIWVWSSYESDWYPGNDKVDIIGYDSYPGKFNVGIQAFMFNALYRLTGGKKIIALTENGPLPHPDACMKQDAPWAWFMTWGDLLYKHNKQLHITEVYHSENVITSK